MVRGEQLSPGLLILCGEVTENEAHTHQNVLERDREREREIHIQY